MITLSGHSFRWVAAAGALGLAGLGEGMDPLRQLRRRWAYYTGGLDHAQFVTTTKTLTYLPCVGNHRQLTPWTSVRRLSSDSLVNAIGLTNPGIHHFAAHYYPRLIARGYSFIVSVAPESVHDAQRIADFAAKNLTKSIALEYNVSCPNSTAHHVADRATVAQALASSGLPVILKLPAEFGDLCTHFRPAAVSLINAVPWLRARELGIVAGESPLARYGYHGSVSGAKIASVSLFYLAAFRSTYPTIPVISVGGVNTKQTAMARLDAGASAVAFWTAFDDDPSMPNRIIASVNSSNSYVR